MESLRELIERIKLGIEKGESDEEIFRQIEPSLRNDPSFDEKLAESLGSFSHETPARILERMLEGSKEKKVKKMIRRSLYRLRSKGVVVKEALPEKKPSILRPVPVEPPRGMGGSIDLRGQRLLLLTVPHRGRGETIIEGLVSDSRGLLEVWAAEVSRREARSLLQEIREDSPLPIVEMEASYVGFLFDEAYQLSLTRNGPIPQDYLSVRSQIESVKKEHEKPLIYSLLQSDELRGDDRWVSRGGDLLNVDLFWSWRIEEEIIQPYADQVEEAEESRIVLQPAQKEVRLRGIYEKALMELFSGERRLLYKRRLEEMAYVLLKLGREEEARLSLAVAIDLEKPLNLIRPNPFLYHLVMKSVLMIVADAYQERAKEPSLIVKP